MKEKRPFFQLAVTQIRDNWVEAVKDDDDERGSLVVLTRESVWGGG